MWRDYASQIQETEAELPRLERQHRGKKTGACIRLGRMLKNGEVRSLRQAAKRWGFSSKQGERWWPQYVAGGLAQLLDVKRPPGKPAPVTEEVWEDLDLTFRNQRQESAQ